MIQLKSLALDFIDSKGSEIWGQDLSFSKGELYHIYSVSGSGKTSFLRILTKEILPTKGQFLVSGKQSDKISIEVLRKDKFSIAFQDLRLIEDLSVFDNLMLRADLFSVSESSVLDMLEILDIHSLKDKDAKSLSRGEQQRVAIIRALIGEFQFLLLDEPFSHLDEESRLKSIQLITQEQKKKGFGLLLCNVAKDQFFNYSKSINL